MLFALDGFVLIFVVVLHEAQLVQTGVSIVYWLSRSLLLLCCFVRFISALHRYTGLDTGFVAAVVELG